MDYTSLCDAGDELSVNLNKTAIAKMKQLFISMAAIMSLRVLLLAAFFLELTKSDFILIRPLLVVTLALAPQICHRRVEH